MTHPRHLPLWLVTLGVVCGLALGMAAPEDAGPRPAPAAFTFGPIRGMTVSCHGSGQSWGTDAMVETMRELRDLGVTWIAIHPYARIGADGSVGGGRTERAYRDATWLTRPIAEAERLGLKIMIKPHLAYWGSPFSWRGEITFADDAAWARFFAEYTAWITMVAERSAGAEAFVVGTELDRTVGHQAEWRSVIAAVRTALPETPLTYAANWDTYMKVPFWDALDAIGIQAYFPLVGHERTPEPAELDAAWRARIAELEHFRSPWNRPVLFTELGYDCTTTAARTPWTPRRRGVERDETIQQRCLAAALRAIDAAPGIDGAFLWKWFPGESSRGNFLKSTPAMRAVLAERWGPAEATEPADAAAAGD